MKINIGILIFSMAFLLNIPENSFAQNNKKEKGFRGNKGNGNHHERLSDQKIEGVNIILGSPTDKSIIASVITEHSASIYIEYYIHSASDIVKTSTVQCNAGEPKEISIQPLQPNTKYHYRLNYKFDDQTNYTKTEESWFSTQKSKWTSFSFGVQGDSHPEREGKMFNRNLYRQTVDSVSALQPDFYFMLGDDFSLDKTMNDHSVNKNTVEGIYKIQRNYWGNAGKNPPLFLVNGNHEQAAKYLLDGTPDNPAVIAANARNKFYPLPNPNAFYSGDKETVEHVGLLKDYYAFEWGNSLFVVIDPYWHSDIPVDNQPGNDVLKSKKDFWSITIGDQQYQWLKNILEKSTAKHKFVFAHHVLGTGRGGVERAKYFEWGGYNQRGDYEFKKYRPSWELPIHQLLVKNKVDIFFQGHDHIFAKQELDGVIYQSVPNPADDTHTAFNREAYQSGVILPNSGFLYVTVNGDEVKVAYKRSVLTTNISTHEEQEYNYTIR